MRMQTLGDKPPFVDVNISPRVAVSAGQPVVLAADGTNDGFEVVLPSGSTAALASTLLMGVALNDLAAYEVGNARVFGKVEKLRLITGTRAASTDSYASYASVIAGAVLSLNTAANGFVTGASVGASAFQPAGALLETVASVASAASTTSDTSVVRYTDVKAFVRML